MEIGPEPRRPCDFPGQPAHQNGPRSRPMGMGRAFSCPFLGNSSAPRGAAGAQSAAAPPSDAPASPKAESRPRPILGESAGQPNPFFRKVPQPETQPFAHVPGPLASNLWEGSAAPPGSGCPAWDGAGGAAAFGGPGAEGPRACQTKRAGPGARSFRALRALPPPPRRHPRQGSSRFPPAEAGAKAAGFRQ